MHWRITSNGEVVDIQAVEVVTNLLGAVRQRERPDQEELGIALTKFLEAKETLHGISLCELVNIAFQTGYFYRIFMDKNDIEIVEDPSYEAASITDTE